MLSVQMIHFRAVVETARRLGAVQSAASFSPLRTIGNISRPVTRTALWPHCRFLSIPPGSSAKLTGGTTGFDATSGGPGPSTAGRLEVTPASQSAALARLRMIGDTILTTKCTEVDPLDPGVAAARKSLHETLAAFRAAHGFGRAIAANQIGFPMRMIAFNMGGSRGPFTMHNPVLMHPSQEMMTMWDDCFSFDCLLVRRHRDVGVRYVDDTGVTVEIPSVGRAMAELLQHETDHLDGLTSFDRMLPGPGSVVHRSVYDANREHYDAMVDYSIAPTIAVAAGKPRLA